MSDRKLLDYCWEKFCDYDVCKALECEDACENDDCPLVQLFERVAVMLKEDKWKKKKVAHGRWVWNEYGWWQCSECGCSPADWEPDSKNEYGLPPYCHSCGAKNDGERKDNER